MILKFFKDLLKFILFVVFLVGLSFLSGFIVMKLYLAGGEVEVPDLTGKEVKEAERLLAMKGLSLKQVDGKNDPSIPKNHILSQDPGPNSRIKQNRTVRVVLSLGPEEVTVPTLVGKPLRNAQILLRQNGLLMGRTVYIHSDQVPMDSVIAQNPPGESKYSKKGKVDLLLSRGPFEKSYIMPDLIGKKLDLAKKVLEEIGLVVGRVEREVYDGVGLDVIISQNPKPGTIIKKENLVNLVVSSGSFGPETESRFIPTSPVTHVSLEYVVPEGPPAQEVRVLVNNDHGVSEIFKQFLPPGMRIQVAVPVIGETLVGIYIDGMLVQQRRF
jgi:beta-lactam-binding protein with PASTA domain